MHDTSEATFFNNTILPRYYEPTTTDYLPSNNFTAYEQAYESNHTLSTMTNMTYVRLDVWPDLSAMHSVSIMFNTPDNSNEAWVINQCQVDSMHLPNDRYLLLSHFHPVEYFTFNEPTTSVLADTQSSTLAADNIPVTVDKAKRGRKLTQRRQLFKNKHRKK